VVGLAGSEPVADAVIPADPLEEHFAAFTEPVGALFPVEFLMAVKPRRGS
jgi:hypothetical protein